MNCFGCERRQPVDIATVTGTSAGAVASTQLAEITEQHKLFSIDVPSSHGTPNYTVVFSKGGNAVAYKASRGGEYYVVLNGVAGKAYQEVSDMTFSPDGKRFAYATQRGGKSRMVVDGKEGIFADSLGAPIFSPDNRHLLYYAKLNNKWQLVVDDRVGDESLTVYDQFFSSDSNRVITFEQADKEEGSPYSLLKVFGLDLQLRKSKRLIATNRVYNFNKSRMAAVSEFEGKQRLIQIDFDAIDILKEGPIYDRITHVAFGSDGNTLAYGAERFGKRYLIINDKELLLSDGEIVEPPAVNAVKGNVGIITANNGGYFVFPVAGGARKHRYQEAAYLKFNYNGDCYAHVALANKQQQYVVNGNPGPSYDKALPPIFSPDGRHLVGRVRKDGKRFVVVLDSAGKLVQQHPAYEMVFEPVFTKDGKAVAYGVKDGNKLLWKVEKLP